MTMMIVMKKRDTKKSRDIQTKANLLLCIVQYSIIINIIIIDLFSESAAIANKNQSSSRRKRDQR